jgi:hypothetical protein
MENEHDTTHKGIITFESGAGWFFCEDSLDHGIVFVHLKYSSDNRYLHVNDIITFQRAPSLKYPGKFEARDIRYSAHCIARQISQARGGQS